jgi:hypothetical protein
MKRPFGSTAIGGGCTRSPCWIAYIICASPKIQRPRHALLDAVDHRQLGVALLGLLQQALRLVEQACVFERHAHARGHRTENAHLGIAKSTLPLMVL